LRQDEALFSPDAVFLAKTGAQKMALRPYFSRLPAFAKLAKVDAFLFRQRYLLEGRIPHFLLSFRNDFQADFRP
jgi:hypothetical protein